MIPINSRYIPKKIIKLSKLKKIIITLILLLVVSGFAYYELLDLRKEILRGPDFSAMRKMVTLIMFDSLNNGLDKYYTKYGHYPNIQSKYFFDSIKEFIGNLEPYVYRDSLDSNGKLIQITNALKYKEYLVKNNCFIGIGRYDICNIIYRKIKGNNKPYILYSTGENNKDEYGEGDDMVFKKRW